MSKILPINVQKIANQKGVFSLLINTLKEYEKMSKKCPKIVQKCPRNNQLVKSFYKPFTADNTP